MRTAGWFTALSPFRRIMLLAVALRLVSVIFSKGFGWHDDHFLIIEASQSWADGFDYNYWLPDPSDPSRQPQGHSLTYVGLHYFFFVICKAIGLDDPQAKMMLVRMFHALWSLLIVRYSWRIAYRHGGERAAITASLLAATFWFMPFMSVRNLAEFVCVPALLAAVDRIDASHTRMRDFLISGLWLGVACSFRFQAVFIVAGIGMALLIHKTHIRKLVAMGVAFICVLTLTQGVVDYLIWKKPFAEFLAYSQYNLDHAGEYGTDNWHMYFDLMFGLLIPPLSIVLVAGYFKTWRMMKLVFWPALIYLAFHTWFPNKQERFIMTALPFMVISGSVGAIQIYDRFRPRFSTVLIRFCIWFVAIVNVLLLVLFTPSYSKRHRVEAMYYLYKKNDSSTFIVEDSNKESDFLMPPLFYYGKWFSVPGITRTFTADSVKLQLEKIPGSPKPGYVIFWQAENIEQRVSQTRRVFPTLTYETTIEPSLIDRMLYRLNPLNDNQTAYIYKL